MDDKILRITVASMAWLAAVFFVNAYQIECPKELKVKKYVENLTNGWEVVESEDGAIYEPLSIAVYYNKPVKKIQQKPEETLIGRKNWGKQFELTWQVSRPIDDIPFYVDCIYVGSKIEMIKKIDRSVNICKSFYSEDKYGKVVNNVVSLSCTTNKTSDTKN
ncbi:MULTISPECIES: STY0301 family protein [unclassified Gilliamella]|uniref:STY0301 family protein n=1 Tax=unclassified Gilliamella TaxID=2685620 RepID=UPI002269AA41|nr:MULTISPECIES: STY0301 family protein [unclassified Gilliamella]MCX8663967.1 hypothetical protein [Gilliamella sp. B2887]MCX8698005.1 hypothetical protein [Gilliamella sp. B3000]